MKAVSHSRGLGPRKPADVRMEASALFEISTDKSEGTSAREGARSAVCMEASLQTP